MERPSIRCQSICSIRSSSLGIQGERIIREGILIGSNMNFFESCHCLSLERFTTACRYSHRSRCALHPHLSNRHQTTDHVCHRMASFMLVQPFFSREGSSREVPWSSQCSFLRCPASRTASSTTTRLRVNLRHCTYLVPGPRSLTRWLASLSQFGAGCWIEVF